MAICVLITDWELDTVNTIKEETSVFVQLHTHTHEWPSYANTQLFDVDVLNNKTPRFTVLFSNISNIRKEIWDQFGLTLFQSAQIKDTSRPQLASNPELISLHANQHILMRLYNYGEL